MSADRPQARRGDVGPLHGHRHLDHLPEPSGAPGTVRQCCCGRWFVAGQYERGMAWSVVDPPRGVGGSFVSTWRNLLVEGLPWWRAERAAYRTVVVARARPAARRDPSVNAWRHW